MTTSLLLSLVYGYTPAMGHASQKKKFVTRSIPVERGSGEE
jgi:hypothetical protein